MPSESLRNSELNGKRKVKAKIPKRLRRKPKPNDTHTEQTVTNNVLPMDEPSIEKQKDLHEYSPCLLSASSTNSDAKLTGLATDETSVSFWKNCTVKALNILEQHASSRRKLLIERHQERIDCIRYLFDQREQITTLTEKNVSLSELLESLRNELHTKEDKLHDHSEIIRHNELLGVQLNMVEQKLERITIEYSKKQEENRKRECDYAEQIQSLLDEIERIKRDLVLEEYRKQEAERKQRYYHEKYQIETNLNKKTQQDFIQLKQELKSIQIKYDSLQIEMLEMHKANNNDISLIPTKDNSDKSWTRKRANNHDTDNQLEIKRSKRAIRDRTESSASSTSTSSEKLNPIEKTMSDNIENVSSVSNIKRKTLKPNTKHLPTVTVTQASPENEQSIIAEKDTTQFLISSTEINLPASTDSHDTSCELQPTKIRTKKTSRYLCRRAQRPVKPTDITDQIK